MTSASTFGPSTSLHSIQVLRGLAAMGVVLFHLGASLPRIGVQGAWVGGFSGGVDVFFVISGFIMVHTVANREIGPLSFALSRIRRIVPLYWAVTLFMATVLTIKPGLVNSAVFDPRLLIGSLLFWPVANPALDGALMPLLVPGWTLNLEMFFYTIFAVGLLLSKPLRTSFMFLVLVLVIGLTGAGVLTGTCGFWGQPIVLEFLLGMILADWTRNRGLPTVPIWLPFVAGALLVLLGSIEGANEGWARFFLRGLPALVVVGGALSLEAAGRNRFPALAHLLGDASYSLYLVHGIVLSAFTTVWIKAGFADLPATISVPLFALAATVTATLGGVLTWRFFERPVDRALRKGINNFKGKGIPQ
jgi:exopolysaccharide production protein ExoZ